jgi:hypothetical protein
MSDRKKSYPQEFRNDVREILGARGHEIANVTSADYVPTNKNCRYFECSTAGIVKILYTDDYGSEKTRVLNAVQGINHYPNITRVYRYYTGTTAVTTKTYTDAGAEVTGIALIY